MTSPFVGPNREQPLRTVSWINAPNEDEADRLFAALGEGGQVQMPMMKTFFSPRFGMVADRFGVSWMVIVGVA